MTYQRAGTDTGTVAVHFPLSLETAMHRDDISHIEDDELDSRLTLAEALLWTCDSPRSLIHLTRTFHTLAAEHRRRDLIHRPEACELAIGQMILAE